MNLAVKFTKPDGIAAKGLVLSAVIVILDQVSKFYILNILNLGDRPSLEILPFFNLVMVWNRGISFGMLREFAYGQVLFSLFACIIVICLLIWLVRAKDIALGLALGLVIGGAAGNIIDRLRFAAVADFLDFHIGGYHWPAFNIADSAICIGAFCLALYSLFDNKKEKV